MLERIRAHFVAAGTNRRSSPDNDIFGVSFELLAQGMHHLFGDFCPGSAPAGVGDADYPLLRVEKNQRDAVGNQHQQADARFVCYQPVDHFEGLAFLIDNRHIGRMGLLGGDEGVGGKVEGAGEDPPVLKDIFRMVARVEGEVEGVVRRWAYTTLTGGDKVGYRPLEEDGEEKKGQGVDSSFNHN